MIYVKKVLMKIKIVTFVLYELLYIVKEFTF